MVNCLIVSNLQKSLDTLIQLLNKVDITNVSSVKSGREARRLLTNQHFDLIVINTPLADEFGYELAYAISCNSDSGVIMLVKNEMLDEIRQKNYLLGIMCIGKPFDYMMFQQTIHLALSAHYRVATLQKEKMKLLETIKEIRLVNRAKYKVMEEMKMSESQAHHYIERRAMDQRKKKLKIATEILKTYE